MNTTGAPADQPMLLGSTRTWTCSNALAFMPQLRWCGERVNMPAFAPTTDSLFSDRRDCCYGSGQISWRANGGSHAAGYAVREERRCARCVSGVWRWSDQSGYGSRVRIEHRKLLGPTRLGSLSESIG